MSDAPSGHFSVEVNRIEQKRLNCSREYGTSATPPTGEAVVQFKLEEVDGEEFSRDVSCRVELNNGDGDTLFTAVSEYRVGHDVEVEGDFPRDAISDTLAELALRVSYPYHRSSISNAVLLAGLPPFLLPLAADTEWLKVVRDQKRSSKEEASSTANP
jgi:preprotein translocase subunit SecB